MEWEESCVWAGVVPIDAGVNCSSEMEKVLESFIKFVVVGLSHCIQCVVWALTV